MFWKQGAFFNALIAIKVQQNWVQFLFCRSNALSSATDEVAHEHFECKRENPTSIFVDSSNMMLKKKLKIVNIIAADATWTPAPVKPGRSSCDCFLKTPALSFFRLFSIRKLMSKFFIAAPFPYVRSSHSEHVNGQETCLSEHDNAEI